jgi:hypothetical protein
VGLATKATDVVAADASEPDAGLKVSQDCVLVADQLSVVPSGPVFPTDTLWLEVAVAPTDAV